MTNYRIKILISTAVFALLGILFMQFLWMRHAYLIHEEDFERKVYEALNASVQKHQQQNDIQYIVRRGNSDFTTLDSLGSFTLISDSLTAIMSDEYDEITVLSDLDLDFDEQRVRVRSRSDHHVDEDEDILWIDENEANTITDIHFEKKDSIFRWHYKKMDSIQVIIEKTMKGFEERTVELNKTFEMVRIELDKLNNPDIILDSFDDIDGLLLTELTKRGIELPFHTYILNSPFDSIPDQKAAYSVPLHPYGIIQNKGVLSVTFEDKAGFLFGSLIIMASASLLFTMVVVLIFIITVRLFLKQKKISDIKTDFINNMTHEFKTPIATISLATDSIDNEKVIYEPERIRYFTAMIREENKRMNSRVESVLQMSLLDKKDFDLRPEPAHIHPLLINAAEHIRLQAQKLEGDIQLDLQANEDILLIDEPHFINVLYNILDNALKYTDKKPLIKISTENRNKGLFIRIRDNGFGMDKQTLDHVFDKFYRKPSGDIHNIKGFGLGLSYARALVELMGGSISAESKIEKGTVFSLFFPQSNHLNN